MSYILIANCGLFFHWQNMMLQLLTHIFYLAIGEKWLFLWSDQNMQKKKSLHFHLPHLVLPASYFHQTRLNLISGLFQHPFHYYFRSVWDISQRTSYVLLLYVYDSFEYLYIYWYNSICHINMKNLCLLNVCPIYGWAIYWNSK